MNIRTLTAQAERYLSENNYEIGGIVSPVPGLLLLKHAHPTELNATLYEPVVCVILQGAKETTLGDTTLKIGAGESLVVSHDLPVTSRIISARPIEPYLAVILTLDVALLRSLYEEVGGAAFEPAGASSLAVHVAEPRLLDGLSRYLSLAGDPIETKVMAPLLRRELHFRLLMAPHGGMLRKLLRHDSHASAIARAIALIRRGFRGSLAVPELARATGMSPSSFHKHFRAITSTTPLQYHKELKLLEAKRLLKAGEHAVSTVAFEVGYESPSQFSREYARKFGVPPRSHLPARA